MRLGWVEGSRGRKALRRRSGCGHRPNTGRRVWARARAEAGGEAERGGFRRAEGREGTGGAKRSRYNVWSGVFGRGDSDKAAEVKGG
jgi:hypothetical protein